MIAFGLFLVAMAFIAFTVWLIYTAPKVFAGLLVLLFFCMIWGLVHDQLHH